MRFIHVLLLLVALSPGFVSALGLGKLDLQSALNEPFNARIELVSATVDELDSLNVVLADEAAFQRAGIPFARALSELRFSIKETESGADYILIYSNDPIREPFLNFLIEVSWSKGRLFREYTALLDPPIYADLTTRKKLTQRSPVAETTGTVIREIEDNKVVYNPEYKKTTPAIESGRIPAARTIDYTGGDYGPVVTGDTLWSIASAMRPDTSVSVQQMMLALLRANPEAFINNNINGLKRGHVLQMPEMSDIKSVGKDDAFSQARLQNNLWEEARGAIAATATRRPEGAGQPAPAQPASAGVEPAPAETAGAMPEGEPGLRLVAPAEEGKTMGQGGEAATEALTQELALVNESLEALKLENVDLKDKLSETEAIVDDLKRLIALKENELAALQQQIAKAEMEKAAAAEQKRAQEAQAAKPKPGPEAQKMAKAEQAPEKPAGKQPAAKPAEPKATETPGTSLIPFDLTGVIDIVRNNTLYIIGALGGILLVLISIIFVRRRQSQTAVVIPQSAFPEFEDLTEEPEVSEDDTDINPALAEEEAETILPGAEDETIAPEFAEDRTQIAAPPAFKTAPAPAPAAGAPVQVAQEEEEDPLAEVNVFLAYEHFDQAEEFVKNAIKKDPDNLEFHNKLLEVYYAANNKKGYEEAARVLYDKVNGQGDYWNMAVAMWQEISPNRELFAEPVAGEEEEDTGLSASAGGGGIVNIAGDEGSPGALDLDLDTTAGGTEMPEAETSEDNADILDVTAAVDSGEDILDVTAAVNMEDAIEGDQGDELEMEPAEEDEILDISAASGDDEILDISASGADEGLDFSPDTGAAEEAAAEDEGLDMSLDTGAEETAAEDEGLDFSLDMETEEAAAEDEGLDISLDTGVEEAAAEDEGLDFSLDITKDTEATESKKPTEEETDILDVTSAFNLDIDTDQDADAESAAGEDILDVSRGAVNDLLDVTKSNNIDLDNDDDLLDVTTSATQAGMDADELLEVGEESESGTDESALDLSEGGLDFEIAPDDSAEKGDTDTELTFAGIDITADEEVAADVKADESKDKDYEVDMESTMQIPKRAAMETETDETDESVDEFNIVMDEEDDDADRTIMVPRSTGSGEQSEEDEIATQLDLAKAYVELGDTDNAKTILNEIIAVGNAEQKNQAQEMLDQLG